ncbi:MAG: SDR family oxidoreductase [Marinoscillum sp.]
MQNRFDSQVAIVTGSSSGIGRATALLLAEQGANVVLAARREAELESLASEIVSKGGAATFLAGDIADPEYAGKLVTFTVKKFGKLDLAVNNAGALGSLGDICEMSLENWEMTLRVNLTSAFLCARAQLPYLLQAGGNIVYTSSFVGHTVGFPGMGAYGASKSGIIGLVKCLAAEYGKLGVRINAVLPGGTDTPMAREASPTDDDIQQIEKLHAMNRNSKPEEIARAICFLASDEAAFDTGDAMLVDGGISIYRV